MAKKKVFKGHLDCAMLTSSNESKSMFEKHVAKECSMRDLAFFLFILQCQSKAIKKMVYKVKLYIIHMKLHQLPCTTFESSLLQKFKLKAKKLSEILEKCMVMIKK